MRRQNNPQAHFSGAVFTVPFRSTGETGIRPAGATYANTGGYGRAPSSPSRTSTHWINVNGRSIVTTVTSDPQVIDGWIAEVTSKTYKRGMVVGIDCEWKPNFIAGQKNNKVALLQLCVGSKCLVVQLLYINCFRSLARFLLHPSAVFVGVGIQGDVRKLGEDYGFTVGSWRYDLAELAASKMCRADLRRQGLKGLASEVIGLELWKPKSITLSDWSAACLTEGQIEYACIDAYASFAIGMRLLGRRF